MLVKLSQLTFTCSKSTIETLEKSVKYVQSFNKVFLGVSIVDFEQINVSWDISESVISL